MNLLDIIILIIAAWGFIRGLRKGLFYIVLSLAGILAGLVLATRFSGKLIPFLGRILPWDEKQLQWAAYVIVFLIVLIIARLISILLEKFFTWTGLGWMNRFAGAAVSTLKYLLLAGLLFTAVDELQAKFTLFPPSVFESSRIYKPLVQQTRKFIQYAGDWKDEFLESLPLSDENNSPEPSPNEKNSSPQPDK